MISTILDICTINSYENVTNYEWLICHVIFSIAKIKEQKHHFEKRISQILIDISSRLEDVRAQAITKRCAQVFDGKESLIEIIEAEEFLQSVLFVISEYIDDLDNFKHDNSRIDFCQKIIKLVNEELDSRRMNAEENIKIAL